MGELSVNDGLMRDPASEVWKTALGANPASEVWKKALGGNPASAPWGLESQNSDGAITLRDHLLSQATKAKGEWMRPRT